jgi:hypothetical protein
MPVLLLARGDKEGRELLRKALQARYGMGAPALESLSIRLQGRARVKVGPLTHWASLQTDIKFAFPGRARWDSTIRALGVTLRTYANAFDGTFYRKAVGNNPVQTVTKPEWVRAARLRLMASSGMLLTPLAEQFIELKGTGERSFEAKNIETQDTVSVTLHEDYTLDTVSTLCLNPDQDFREMLFSLQASGGQIAVHDLMLPGKVTISWNNTPEYEVTPVSVDVNAAFDESQFLLENRI